MRWDPEEKIRRVVDGEHLLIRFPKAAGMMDRSYVTYKQVKNAVTVMLWAVSAERHRGMAPPEGREGQAAGGRGSLPAPGTGSQQAREQGCIPRAPSNAALSLRDCIRPRRGKERRV